MAGAEGSYIINLVNGFPQSPSALIVPNGSISFQLNVDGTVIAAPYGFVCAEIPVVFQFDATGALIQPAQLYSNEELQPQNSYGLGTYYLVTFYDQNGARINKSPMWWQFPEAAGATVDISQMTPFASVGGNVIFYPTKFLASPAGASTDVQVNYNGSLYGDAGFTYNPSTQVIGSQNGFLISPAVSSAISLGVTQFGASGSVPYTYSVIAVKGNLNIAVSTPELLSTGNLALSALNYNILAWTAVPGADSYTIWRWVPQWHNNHAYALNVFIVDSNGYLQKVTANGTSGGVPPSWNVTIGGTTTDNTVTWTNEGLVTSPTVGVIATGLTALTANDTGLAATNGSFIAANGPSALYPYVTPEFGWIGISTGLAVTGGGWSGGVFTSANHFGDAVELVDFSIPPTYGASVQSRFEFYDIGAGRSINTLGVSAATIYAQNGAYAALNVSNNISGSYGSLMNIGLNVGANASGVTTTANTCGIFSGCYMNDCTITGDDGGEFGVVTSYRAETECLGGSIAFLIGYQGVTAPENSTITNQINFRSIPRNNDGTGESSTITNIVNFKAESWIGNVGTPAITNVFGFYAQKQWIASGVTGMTLSAAFYAEDQGNVSGAWGVYTAGTTPSHFGGVVSMETLIEAATHTPSSATDTGTTGQIAWDSSYLYVCTATNTWTRVGIATW